MKSYKRIMSIFLVTLILVFSAPLSSFSGIIQSTSHFGIDLSNIFTSAKASYTSSHDVFVVDADGKPLTGAIVQIFSGSSVIWTSSPSVDGGISLEGFDAERNDKATIVASIDIGDGMELRSENISETGVWEGENLKEFLSKDNRTLVLDEPRLHVNLSVAYEESCSFDLLFDETWKAKALFARITYGHIIIDNVTFTSFWWLIPPKVKVLGKEIGVNNFGNYDILVYDGSSVHSCADPKGYFDGPEHAKHVYSCNNEYCAETLCHELGHYICGFYDEYCYGGGYDYDYDNDGKLDTDAGYWDDWIFPDGTQGRVPRPIGAPRHIVDGHLEGGFGLMEDQKQSTSLSNRESYSYLDKYSLSKADDINITKQYKENNGMSCEETMISMLNNLVYNKGYASNTSSSEMAWSATYDFLFDDPTVPGVETGSYVDNLNNLNITQESIADITFEIENNGVSVLADSNEIYLLVQNEESAELEHFDFSLEKDSIGDYTAFIPTEGSSALSVFAVDPSTQLFNLHTLYLNQNESQIEYKNVEYSTEAPDAIVSVAFDECKVINAEHSSFLTNIEVFSENEATLKGIINPSEQIDFSSVSWYHVDTSGLDRIDTYFSHGENDNLIAFADVFDSGKYVLLAKQPSDEALNPIDLNQIQINKSNDSGGIITISIDDERDGLAALYYEIYYADHPFDVQDLNSARKLVFASVDNSVSFATDLFKPITYLSIVSVYRNGQRTTLSENKTISVTEKDSNNDGIPDRWFDEYYMLKDSETIASEDSDFDGISNLEEYNNGTNPLDHDSIVEHNTYNEISDDVIDVIVAEELFEGFSTDLIDTVANTMFNFQSSVDVSSYLLTVDDIVALFSAVQKYYPSEYSILSKTDFSYKAIVSPSKGIITSFRFYYDADVNLSVYQKRVRDLQQEIDKLVAQVEGMNAFEKALYVHDYIVLNCEYDLDLLKMIESQGHLDGEVRSERYTEYSVFVNGTGVCGSYALAYRAALNAAGVECLYISSVEMNHAWNLVKIDGNWYHVDCCWDDPVPDIYGQARRQYFLRTDDEIMQLNHRSWTPGQYRATSTTYSEMPRYDDYKQKYDNGNWYYLNAGKLYSSGVHGDNKQQIAEMTASSIDVQNGEVYYSSGRSIIHYNIDTHNNSLAYVLPKSKAGDETQKAYIRNFYLYDDGLSAYVYGVFKGKKTTKKYTDVLSEDQYGNITGINLSENEITLNVFDEQRIVVEFESMIIVPDVDLVWTSSNNNVASVDNNGVVTAKNVGTATLTLNCLSFSAECSITVTGNGLSGFANDTVKWILNEQTGLLDVFGNGKIPSTTPWEKYKKFIKRIIIRDEITYIPEQAFKDYPILEQVEIGSSVKQLGTGCFYNCDVLSKVILNEGLEKIGDYQFFNCCSLQEITIPNTVSYLGHSLFANCFSLQEVTIPSSTQTIKDHTFSNCKSLSLVVLPDALQSIECCAFSGCESLEGIILNENLISIGKASFKNCGLKQICVENAELELDDAGFSCLEVILGHTDSPAHVFANNNNISFLDINESESEHIYFPDEIIRNEASDNNIVNKCYFCENNESMLIHSFVKADKSDGYDFRCSNCNYRIREKTNELSIGKDIVNNYNRVRNILTNNNTEEYGSWLFDFSDNSGIEHNKGELITNKKDFIINEMLRVLFSGSIPMALYKTGFEIMHNIRNELDSDPCRKTDISIGNIYTSALSDGPLPLTPNVISDPNSIWNQNQDFSLIDERLTPTNLFGDTLSAAPHFERTYFTSLSNPSTGEPMILFRKSLSDWNDVMWSDFDYTKSWNIDSFESLENAVSSALLTFWPVFSTLFTGKDSDSATEDTVFSMDIEVKATLDSVELYNQLCAPIYSILGKEDYYSISSIITRIDSKQTNADKAKVLANCILKPIVEWFENDFSDDPFRSLEEVIERFLSSPILDPDSSIFENSTLNIDFYNNSIRHIKLYDYKCEVDQIAQSLKNDIAINKDSLSLLNLNIDDCPVAGHHEYELCETHPSTCISTGYEIKECVYCHSRIEKELDISTGHSITTTVHKPTCINYGYTEDQCDLCGETFAYNFTSPLGHKLSLSRTTENCTAHGSYVYTCSRCDYREEVVIDTAALETETITTPATCTLSGSEKQVCKLCGATVSSRIIPASGHQFEEDFTIDVEPTCTADGSKSKHCQNCDITILTETVPASGHAYGAWTKFDNNQHQRVCANDPNHIEKADHTWNVGTVTKDATCKETGTRTYTCTTCNATKTETISKNAANHASYGTTVKNIVDASCTAKGYTGDTICNGCGTVVSRGSETAALGHTVPNGSGNCDRCGAHLKDVDSGNSKPAGACKYCGQVHTGPFGWLIKIFHSILALFGLRK